MVSDQMKLVQVKPSIKPLFKSIKSFMLHGIENEFSFYPIVCVFHLSKTDETEYLYK